MCEDVDVLVSRGYSIAELLECFVAGWLHGEVDFAIVVVPVEVDLNVFCSCDVCRDILVAFESVDQVVRDMVGGVFDTRTVNNECELDVTCVVFPQTRNNVALSIPGCILALFHAVLSKTASLRKSVHVTNASNVYPSVKCGPSPNSKQ